MADRSCHDLDPLLLRGLVSGLVAPATPGERLDSVARARRHAAARSFDDGAVVEEIASRLLVLSRG